MSSEIPSVNFDDNYEIVKQLGQGTFAKVVEAIDLQKSQNCAIKQIYIQKYMLDEVTNEVNSLKALHNEHIISYNNSFYDEAEFNLNLVMEICKESLRGQLQHKQVYHQLHLRSFLVQMTSAFLELEAKNIMHLDLKPENILIVNQEGNYYKICDFGCSQLSNFSKMSGYENNAFGTFNYLAPEIHLNYKGKRHRSSADMWSLGITLYEMVFWKLPFPVDQNKLSKRESIKGFFDGKIKINYQTNQASPLKIIQMIKMMLKRDPIKRITWAQMKALLKSKLNVREFQFVDIKETIIIVNQVLQLFIRMMKMIQNGLSQRATPFYKKNHEAIQSLYCSLTNYIYHMAKYYLQTQKYRFQSQALKSKSRINCNKLVNQIQLFLKNICAKENVNIQFDLNALREVELDFQSDLRQFKPKLQGQKGKSTEQTMLLTFLQQIQFSISKNLCVFTDKNIFARSNNN